MRNLNTIALSIPNQSRPEAEIARWKMLQLHEITDILGYETGAKIVRDFMIHCDRNSFSMKRIYRELDAMLYSVSYVITDTSTITDSEFKQKVLEELAS